MIWKAICRDVFSKQRVFLFCISLMIVLMIKNSLSNSPDLTVLLYSVLIISLISSWQLFFSFFTSARIQGYYQLPISVTQFNLHFLCIAFISNLIERILLIVVLFNEKQWENVILLILYSFFVIVSSFRLIRYWNVSNRKLRKVFVVIYILFLLLILPTIKSIFLILLFTVIELLFTLRDKTYLYLDNISSKDSCFNFKNYFISSIFKEKYFYFNTGVAILFIFTLFFQDLPENLKFPMLFSIAATNTPLTTLISSTPQLNLHIRSLPSSRIIYNMYLRCLIYYFFIINISISLLYVKITNDYEFIICVCVYTLLESMLYLLLEKYFCIEKWKIKKELWKHPRKYIVPIITYLYFFIICM